MEEFLKHLKMYQDGKCELEDVRPYFMGLNKFHDFEHYLSDSDIRQKDNDYAQMQNDELKKFINAIEAGNYEQAQSITFISSSV